MSSSKYSVSHVGRMMVLLAVSSHQFVFCEWPSKDFLCTSALVTFVSSLHLINVKFDKFWHYLVISASALSHFLSCNFSLLRRQKTGQREGKKKGGGKEYFKVFWIPGPLEVSKPGSMSSSGNKDCVRMSKL